MKTLSRAELDRSLRSTIEPLYLLVGGERFLRTVAARAITDAALAGTLLQIGRAHV